MKSLFIGLLIVLCFVSEMANAKSAVFCGDLQRREFYGEDIGEPTDNDKESLFYFDNVGRNCVRGTRKDYHSYNAEELYVEVEGRGINLHRGDNPLSINNFSMNCSSKNIEGVYKASFVRAQIGVGLSLGLARKKGENGLCVVKGFSWLLAAGVEVGASIKIKIRKADKK